VVWVAVHRQILCEPTEVVALHDDGVNDYELWGVEVAGDLHAWYDRSLSECPPPLSEFAVGTAGPWLWVVYRLTDAFSGPGSSAFLRGVAVDLRVADDELGLMGAPETLVEAVWFGLVAEPQGNPEPLASVLMDGVWWLSLPPLDESSL